MDVGSQRLEPFLVNHSKMLLFIDDDQTKTLELDTLREDRVRANDDIDGPIGNALPGLFCFSGRNETRKPADLDRKALKALIRSSTWLALI